MKKVSFLVIIQAFKDQFPATSLLLLPPSISSLHGKGEGVLDLCSDVLWTTLVFGKVYSWRTRDLISWLGRNPEDLPVWLSPTEALPVAVQSSTSRLNPSSFPSLESIMQPLPLVTLALSAMPYMLNLKSAPSLSLLRPVATSESLSCDKKSKEDSDHWLSPAVYPTVILLFLH